MIKDRKTMITQSSGEGLRHQTGTGQGQGRETVLERKGNSWSQSYRGFFVTLYILVSTYVFPMCVEAYMFHCMYEIILHCNKHRQGLYMFQMMPIAWSATPSAFVPLFLSPVGVETCPA